MHYIHPADEVSRLLHGDLLFYRTQYKNPVIEPVVEAQQELLRRNHNAKMEELGRQNPGKAQRFPVLKLDEVLLPECVKIVHAMLEDCVSDRMIWAGCEGSSDRLNACMSLIFPDWNEPANATARRHFYDNVLDNTFLQVAAWVQNAIRERSWNIWFVRKVGNDVMLECGSDFRIVDWTRRMESGQWRQREEYTSSEQEAIERASEADIQREENGRLQRGERVLVDRPSVNGTLARSARKSANVHLGTVVELPGMKKRHG